MRRAKHINVSEVNPEKFWSKVLRGDLGQCWPWIGASRMDGYGVIKAGNVAMKAHRVAYALEHGTVNRALVIDHTCDCKACCNPAHLEAVTQSENSLRHKRTVYRGVCKRGHTREYGAICKVCRREHVYRWTKANPIRAREIQRRYRAKRKALAQS